jgi:hypothetical protein
MSQAYVNSVDALKRLREGHCSFLADIREALSTAEMDIRRVFDWLHEQMKIWEKEIHKRQDLVGQARVALNRKKIQRVFGRQPDTTEEEKILRKAQQRLREAEEMVVAIRRWGPQLQHAVTQYEGPARQLASYVDGVAPRDVALLERKIEALEEYVRLAPPSAPAAMTEAGSAAVPFFDEVAPAGLESNLGSEESPGSDPVAEGESAA